MFCSKCGSHIADGQRFCSACGTPVPAQFVQQEVKAVQDNVQNVQENVQNNAQNIQQQTQQFVQNQNNHVPQYQPQYQPQPQYQQPLYQPQQQYQQPQYQQPQYQPQYQQPQYRQPQQAAPYANPQGQNYAPNFAQPAAAAPKKGGGGKAVGIIIAVIAVIALIVASIIIIPKIMGGGIGSASVDAKTEVSRLESKDMASFVSMASDFSEELTGGDKTGYEITITPGEMIKDLIGSSGADVDLSWLKSVTAVISTDLSRGNEPKARINLSLNGKQIAAAEALVNTDDDMAYISLPGLSNKVFGVEADGLNIGKIDRVKVDRIIKRAYNLIQQYYARALNHVTDFKKESGTIRAVGIEQKCDVLTAEFTDKLLYEIARDIAEDIKKNGEVKNLLQDVYDVMTNTLEMDDYENFNEFYEQAMASVDEFIEDIPEVEAGSEGNVAFILREYVVSNEIRGREIEVVDDDIIDLPFDKAFMGIAYDGKDFGAEITADGQTYVTASGTSSNNKVFDGKATIKYEGEAMASVEFKNLDKDQHTGELTLSLTENAWRLLFNTADDFGPLGSLDILDSLESVSQYLRIAKINLVVRKGGVSVDISVSGSSVLKVDVNKKSPEGISVSRSSNPADVSEITSSIDFDKLKSNLKSAGVPEEYLSYIDMLKGQIYD